MTNVFYVPSFNSIGGIETLIHELVKKYRLIDITVVYSFDDSDAKQMDRVRKYARVVKQPFNAKEKIKCKKLFVAYKCNLDLFEADEIVHMAHARYKSQGLRPIVDKRITEYYAVSKSAAKEFEEISGKETKVCYNVLNIEEPKRILLLVSATRLTKEKGLENIKRFADELDRANIPYLWFIFTNKQDTINNPNIIFMKPRLDIRGFVARCDYLVQLSTYEAWCYSVDESLNICHTPVIVTDQPCYKEMGVKNGVNGYIIDMNNIPIDDIYNKIPTNFKMKRPKDIYDQLLINEPSTYVPERIIRVKCIKPFKDSEENIHRTIYSKSWEVRESRAKELRDKGLVKYA